METTYVGEMAGWIHEGEPSRYVGGMAGWIHGSSLLTVDLVLRHAAEIGAETGLGPS